MDNEVQKSLLSEQEEHHGWWLTQRSSYNFNSFSSLTTDQTLREVRIKKKEGPRSDENPQVDRLVARNLLVV